MFFLQLKMGNKLTPRPCISAKVAKIWGKIVNILQPKHVVLTDA